MKIMVSACLLGQNCKYIDAEEKLVGFARIISDYATTFYLADVIINPEYQHQGLGTALVSYAVSRPV